jgi:hypothetical protein
MEKFNIAEKGKITAFCRTLPTLDPKFKSLRYLFQVIVEHYLQWNPDLFQVVLTQATTA